MILVMTLVQLLIVMLVLGLTMVLLLWKLLIQMLGIMPILIVLLDPPSTYSFLGWLCGNPLGLGIIIRFDQ
jgi:hypothetical protein